MLCFASLTHLNRSEKRSLRATEPQPSVKGAIALNCYTLSYSATCMASPFLRKLGSVILEILVPKGNVM